MSSITCSSCQAAMPAGTKFCTSCGHALAPTTAPTSAAATTSTQLTAGTWQPTAPTEAARRIDGVGVRPSAGDAGMNGIRLARGERVERSYVMHPRQRPLGSAQGTLLVTNERVVYRAEALTKVSRDSMFQEIHLRDVNGVHLRAQKGMSAKDFSRWMTWGLVWLLVFWYLADRSSDPYGYESSNGTAMLLVLVWLLGGAIAFWLKWGGQSLDLVVRGAHGTDMPIRVSGGVSQLSVGSILARFRPGQNLLQTLGIIDADSAAVGIDHDSIRTLYNDLGATILDLQADQRASQDPAAKAALRPARTPAAAPTPAL